MKKIVIIGASSGIGHRVAADFARMGWRVGVAARREEPLRKLKEQYPENMEYLTMDVTSPTAAGRLCELIELIDGMDVLLFCSGVGFNDPDLNQAKLTNTLEVNVVGFARIVAEAYKYYRRTANVRPGRIAAITSVAGVRGLGTAAAYSSSKGFQQRFLDCLEQLSYRQQVNVRFTDIRPGFVRTDLLDADRNYPMMMSVDYVAPLIESAILRGKRVATIDSRWRILTALWRLIPDCIWRRTVITLDNKKDNKQTDTPIISTPKPTAE